jgi:hypothetical protein
MRVRGVALGFAGVALTLLVSGCGDSDKDPEASAGSGAMAGTSGRGGSGGTGELAGTGGTAAGASGSSGAAGSAPICNDLVLDAPAWGLTYDAGPQPEAEGGEFADGTYFLTKEIVYDTASGIEVPLARSQISISGSTWQEVEGGPDAGDPSRDRRRTSTATVVGTHLTLQRTCGGTNQEEADFTAGDDGFTLFFSDAGADIGAVFEKQ